jgi:hypothetical protein
MSNDTTAAFVCVQNAVAPAVRRALDIRLGVVA